VNTYAIQLLLHFQSERGDDTRLDDFIDDLKCLAAKHGITLDDHQSMRLRDSDYRIAACPSCGHLTVNRDDVDEAIEKMLPDFWFYIRRGTLAGGRVTCDRCQQASAT